MSLPSHHAWTHRPKAEGGTDPIEFPEAASGIVSHFPRHPIHVTNSGTEEYTMWPGGVVVVSAVHHSVTGSSTTDATNNYSSQSFLRYTTAATSYAAAANLIVIDPAAIGLLDDHAYMILAQYRLGSVATGIKIGWTHAGATPAEVSDTFPASSPANSWFSLGGMVHGTVGTAKVQHGTNIEIRAYHTSSAVQIDFDQLFFIPHDYQDGSPAINTDPAVFDTYIRVPDTGQLNSTTSIQFPDNTHYWGQCIADTQTCMSILDPNFRWSTTTWSNGYQPSPQGSLEADGFAWEAGHGRHLYASARLQGESGQESTAFTAGALVAYGSNGMPHASSILWNNSWQLVYLGPMSPSHEIPHLGGMVIAADPGGNEAPFNADGETTVADVRMATLFEVSCLYDPQSV